MPSQPDLMVTIRPFAEGDSVAELTELLHRSYAPLAARGLRYLATHQDAETTSKRMKDGECLLAFEGDRLVGAITWHGPKQGGNTAWAERPGVATFQQFCVEPARQNRGIATSLLHEVERRARAAGATELSCDTAEPATDLIGWYLKRGFRKVGTVDWRPVTNYPSVILSKSLA